MINVLRVQQEVIDPKEQLNEIEKKFWNLDSSDISKNEFDFYENFEADISFASNHYEMKLPLKPEQYVRWEFVLGKSRLKMSN